MFSRKNQLLRVILLISTTCIMLSACQLTPNESVIKGKIDLNTLINQPASPDDKELPNISILKYEKSYDSGNKVCVDATVLIPTQGRIPVISMEPVSFQNKEWLKQIVRLFCPDEQIYEQGMSLTKSDIEKEILYYKELLFRAENNLDLLTGEPSEDESATVTFEAYTGNADGASVEDQLKAIIEDYEKQYQSAPEDTDLNQTNYTLRDVGGSYQLNLKAVSDGPYATLDFVNWNVGSSFHFRRPEYLTSDLSLSLSLQLPDYIGKYADLNNEEKEVQKYLQAIGIDYMTLYTFSKGVECNTYYYVRSVNGLYETYAKNYFGTQPLDHDGYPVMDLWRQEYLVAVMLQGRPISLEWINPSSIVNIDNENVKILSWTTIEQIFKNQVDLLLTPAPYSSSQDAENAIFAKPTTIHINRIELGLTKLLMKNSKSYKLIPSWSFFGYDENFVDANITPGAEICFITINALDGSIIDRGQMY